MSLNLAALGEQVRQMSQTVAREARQRDVRVAEVCERYLHEIGREEHWAAAVKLSEASANWLLAAPVEPLDTVRDLPPIPTDYAIAATDGSHIDVDRHGEVSCYLINIGKVYIRYGAQPEARLESSPKLYFAETDLFFHNDTRRIPIEGALLSVRRDVEEGVALGELAIGSLTDPAIPRLALQDGTLIRWALANADAQVRDHFLRQYLTYLERMRQHAIPVASYISRSRSPEVMGLVRLMFCPDVNVHAQRGANCAQCSDAKQGRMPSCMVCQDLIDADIFAPRLREGQRSPIFRSLSRISVEGYEHHQIHFFFLRVGRELARIELPGWVAGQPEWVDQVHVLVYDQAARGQGYPIALQRAHEQAVIRSAERRVFEQMVSGALQRAEAPAGVSAKRESKQFVQG
ncbi:DNA double-strand break repair nuclease NurA [uncultured Chloroflexus sp.]|uniref:DNA double-strand break repair nuclease NurA n=1 Tax=uncultured Chloroflexus sp. TaxID=214040 RepID=UPI00262449F2|nr:DNA double-strand break repair nuclease NurA [uncultured Chloroflexus sp.]